MPPKLGTKFKLPGRTLKFGSGIGESVGLPPGPTNFLALTDTPDDYDGQAGKYCKVDATEENLIFRIPESFSFTWELTTTVDASMDTIGTTVAQYMIPKSGRVHTLTVVGYNAVAGAFTATLEKGGNPTALSCNVSGTGGTSEFGYDTDTTGISVVATDLLSIDINITSGVGTWNITAVVSGVYD